MLIDGTEFFHAFGDNDGVMAWRSKQIIPRYNAAGVTRFAFQLPSGTPGTTEAGGAPAIEQGANFPTAWFSTRERAQQWLATGA
jgi:hypothetical protein